MKTADLIKSDLYRHTGNTSVKAFVKQFLINEGFNFMFWYRVANAARGRLPRMIMNHVVRLKQRKYGFVISPGTKIGPGFYIGHVGNIVINPTAVIGANCNISQGVTIGSNDGKAATIGNNVYIGPNVCIVEYVTIGDNVTIGAGSVVTRNVPPNVTVAGCPAKVISDDAARARAGRYVTRRWDSIENASESPAAPQTFTS
ncbi:serine O-acetyltransferase [Burkholderia sp. PU8-34]